MTTDSALCNVVHLIEAGGASWLIGQELQTDECWQQGMSSSCWSLTEPRIMHVCMSDTRRML
eukprot:825763-Amphidinium_carterae.1